MACSARDEADIQSYLSVYIVKHLSTSNPTKMMTKNDAYFSPMVMTLMTMMMVEAVMAFVSQGGGI